MTTTWWGFIVDFMARKLRVEYPGAIYHVINRGDRREPIFKTDADRELFLACLDQCCTKTGWQVHAFFQRRAVLRPLCLKFVFSFQG